MAAESNTHTVKAGQVYEACAPIRSMPGVHFTRIRVVDYTPGSNRADVVDAETGKRPRAVLVSSLHGSGLTGLGLPRRTGYRLVKDVTP